MGHYVVKWWVDHHEVGVGVCHHSVRRVWEGHHSVERVGGVTMI